MMEVYKNPKSSTVLESCLESLDNIDPYIEKGVNLNEIPNISRLCNIEKNPSKLKRFYERIKESPVVKFLTDDWKKKSLIALAYSGGKAALSAIPHFGYNLKEIAGPGYKAVNLKPIYALHHLVEEVYRGLNHYGITSDIPPLEISPHTSDPLDLALTIGGAILLNFTFDGTLAYLAQSVYRRLRKNE